MQIDLYPLFQTLVLEHQETLERLFQNNPPQISEFTFANLYAWRRAYDFKISLHGNFVVLRSDSQATLRYFPLLGSGDVKPVMEQVLRDTQGVFCRLPRDIAGLFYNDPRWLVSADPDNSDYLYLREDLVQLSGRKYDGKRNLIKKFKEDNAYEYFVLTQANAPACLAFEESWCSIKGCDRVEGLSREREAIRDMLANFTQFHLVAGAIQIRGVITALAIGQPLNSQTMVIHILKADPAVPGLYQTMLQEFLQRQAGAFELVNLEQDLGIEGLRKSKLSYHPAARVDKFFLCPAA